MSEMTILFKKQVQTHKTEVFENFNELSKPKLDIDDIFGIDDTALERCKPQGVFKTKFISNEETVFLENYGNVFADSHMNRKTLIVEENENKIALKFYTYNNIRDVSKKFFRVRREISYLTFNIKRKTFYSGELLLKKKVKMGSKFSINKTNLNDVIVFNRMRGILNFGDGSLQIQHEVINLFLDRVAERMDIKFDHEDLSPKDKLYQLYLKISGIKYPDAYSKFSVIHTPKKEIKEHGNNLVTWFMKKNNFKGTKIRELLNKNNNLDIDGINVFYNMLDQDLFNTINSECFLTKDANGIKSFGYYGTEFIDVSKTELKNIVKILNTTTTETLLNSLNDHLQYKESLKRYGEHVKITATNYVDYINEHSEWSTLVQSYRSGTVTRFYGEDAYLIEKPINHNSETYYPVLLKTTEQYENESMVQSNCVRTYIEKPYCFIVSLRKGSVDGDTRASIELRYTPDGVKVVQKLGKYNMGLSEEWLSPINELEMFADYLYKKSIIKLPEMTKNYSNGKETKEVAIFKNEDKIHNMYPIWENQNTISDYLLGELDNYNLFDELF